MDAVATIKQAVAEEFLLLGGDLEGGRRNRAVIMPRWIAMWLVHQFTDHTDDQIGRLFGRRDEQAVRHAIDRICSLIIQDKGVSDLVYRLLVIVRLRISPTANHTQEALYFAGTVAAALAEPGAIRTAARVDPVSFLVALEQLHQVLKRCPIPKEPISP